MIQARYGQFGEDTGSGGALSETPHRFVDLHCHCLPGLDDGPASLADALDLCRALAGEGVELAVATPHQLGRFEGYTCARRVLEATRLLSQELTDRGIDLQVLPGAEVRLDERIGTLLAADEVLTLADRSRYVLVELPNDLFINVEPLLAELQTQGVEVVIAHAERNAPLLRHMGELETWWQYGARVQVTAASLIGRFGPRAYQAAWMLLVEGWVAVIATDAHDCQAGRLCMAEAFDTVADALGRDLATLLCDVNPRRVARGQELIEMYAWSEGSLR